MCVIHQTQTGYVCVCVCVCGGGGGGGGALERPKACLERTSETSGLIFMIEKLHESSLFVDVYWIGPFTPRPQQGSQCDPKMSRILSETYLRDYNNSKAMLKLFNHLCVLAWSFYLVPQWQPQKGPLAIDLHWPGRCTQRFNKDHRGLQNFIRDISRGHVGLFSWFKPHESPLAISGHWLGRFTIEAQQGPQKVTHLVQDVPRW